MTSHYSHSSKNQAQNCPRQYYYRKVRNIPESGKPAFIIGHIVDHVVGAILQGIMNDDPVSDPEGLAVMVMQTELSLNNDIPPEGEQEVRQFMEYAIAEKAFTSYRMMIDFQPVAIQQEMRLWVNPQETPVLGFIDVVAQRKRKPLLIDTKTAGRKPSSSAQYRDQLALYAAWYLHQHGVLPETEILALVKTKHPYWMRVPVELTWQDIGIVLESFYQHERLLTSGQFPPNRNSMFCSEKLCAYWELCHKECEEVYTEEYVKKLLKYSE